MQQRPFEVDATEYPFESRWFEYRGCAMHYVDVGEGLPVVMCHGNPTWSYLYRNIIKGLQGEFRCIAYDMPGFGFSAHPAGFGYTPQEQAEWVEALLFEHLKLERFIIVVQDWGGPIGLSVATRYPERVVGAVISSTWAWPPNLIAKTFSGIMKTSLGQYLVLKRNFFAAGIVPMLLGKRASAMTRKAYTDAFPTPKSRMGPAVLPMQITLATAWLGQLQNRLSTLAAKPIEFVFGLKDMGTRPNDMKLWLTHFPDAGVQRMPEANHFTQEDCPEAFVAAVRRVAARVEKLTPTAVSV